MLTQNIYNIEQVANLLYMYTQAKSEEAAKKEEAAKEPEKPTGDPPKVEGKIEDMVSWNRSCLIKFSSY